MTKRGLLAGRSLPIMVASVLGAAAVVAVIAAVIFVARGEDDTGVAPTPSILATATPARLGIAIDLRSGPSNRVAIVARLDAGAELAIEGRDGTGDWLAVAVVGEPGIRGWVPRNAVIGAPDIGGLTVLGSTPTATGVPTATPVLDLPDLVVATVVSRENRLLVTLANEGTTDVTGTILLAINEAAPTPIEVKAGEPLVAGDELELLLEGEFIQRRGRISVVASTDPPIEEIDHANNRLDVVIEPDLDNDLGLTNATIVSGRGLVVTVRNNSPIPIVGTIAIEVRQTRDDTLLARRSLQIELQPEAIVEVVFESIEELDFTRATVELSSDALDDALASNNVFPR